MNFRSVLSRHLCPRSASLFALLNISGKLRKDWTEWHIPPHYQKMLWGWCLSLSCPNTLEQNTGPFHFLPTNLGQEMVAFWVLETKSKACSYWAVAIDSACDYS